MRTVAHETLDIEAAAVLGIKRHLGEAFVQAVRLMLMVRGRVVVMGSRAISRTRGRIKVRVTSNLRMNCILL